MAVRILGVGLGLFVLLLLWTIALLVCVVLWKSKGAASFAGLGLITLASLITVILVAIPKTDESPETAAQVETKIFDYNFIGRVTLVVIMSVFALIGLVLMIVMHCAQPVFASRLKTIK